jgi:hypothetical protein
MLINFIKDDDYHDIGATPTVSLTDEPAALSSITIIPAGTLDETSWLKPTMEIIATMHSHGFGMHRFPKMHHAKG